MTQVKHLLIKERVIIRPMSNPVSFSPLIAYKPFTWSRFQLFSTSIYIVKLHWECWGQYWNAVSELKVFKSETCRSQTNVTPRWVDITEPVLSGLSGCCNDMGTGIMQESVRHKWPITHYEVTEITVPRCKNVALFLCPCGCDRLLHANPNLICMCV